MIPVSLAEMTVQWAPCLANPRDIFISWHFYLFPTKHAEASKCSVMLFAMAMGVKRFLAKTTRKNRGRIGEFKQSDSQWSSTDVIGGLAVRGASQGPRVTACHEAYVQGRSSQGQRSRQLSPTPVARNLRSQKQNEAKKQDVKWIEIPFSQNWTDVIRIMEVFQMGL